MTSKHDPPDVASGMSAIVSQSLEQARGAVDAYLQLVLNSMAASPWGETDLNRKLRMYAERNVAAAFEFTEKLIHAKDMASLVRVQAEFVEKQLQTLSAQAKDLGETATAATTGALKNPFMPPS